MLSRPHQSRGIPAPCFTSVIGTYRTSPIIALERWKYIISGCETSETTEMEAKAEMLAYNEWLVWYLHKKSSN